MSGWLSRIEAVAMQYGVSAPLLVGLYLVSIPFFYFGLWLCLSDLRTNGLKGSIKRHKFIVGLCILVGAWVLPYAYLLISSRGFPWFIWLGLIILLLLTAHSTWRKLSKSTPEEAQEKEASR